MIMTTLPEDYVLQKFYEHAGYPKHKKITNVHEAGCPICQEGHSWGKKRRAYYIPKEAVICCHNCGWYSKPTKWIMEVARMTYDEMMYEVTTGDYKYIDMSSNRVTRVSNNHTSESLPKDSINLLDTTQVEHYINTGSDRDRYTINKIIKFSTDRRLLSAVNRPRSLYLSLTDHVHKNRLCIPFYNQAGKIVHYQTRGVLPDDLESRPKYLSKMNSSKSLFNYDQIQSDADILYLFEGPLDSFFVRNSVALAGIQENSKTMLTNTQKQMLRSKTLLKHVWVLDNQWIDQASYIKTKQLIESGEHVFIWPSKLKPFKDFNDMTSQYGLNEIDHKMINTNTHQGLSAKLVFSRIKSFRS